MYVTVKFTYRDSVSQKKLDVSQKRLGIPTSFDKKARLTKGIYLNWRLTKEIAVRSVSQKAFI